MSLALMLVIAMVYSAVLGYGMFQLGYSTGFQRAYYYALLVQKAKKKPNEDTTV